MEGVPLDPVKHNKSHTRMHNVHNCPGLHRAERETQAKEYPKTRKEHNVERPASLGTQPLDTNVETRLAVTRLHRGETTLTTTMATMTMTLITNSAL